MKKTLFVALLFGSEISLADHPSEGSEKLPDLIQEALAISPHIRSKLETQAASESLIQAKKSRYYPEFKFVTGRKAVKDKSMKVTLLRSYSQIESKINLYQGGLTNAEVSMYETERSLAQEETATTRIEIASAVASTFFDLQYTLEGLSVVEKVFAELRENKSEAVKRIKTGQVAQSESIQFDLLEAQVKTERVVFQEQEVELNQRLKFLLARPDSKTLQIKGHLVRQRWSINFADAFNKAMKYNNEIVIEQLKTRLLESKVSVETSKFLPSLDAKGSVGRLASDSNPDLGQPGWSAEVILTVPLFDGMSTLRNRDSAIHSLSSQQLEANYTEKKIRQEIKDLINHFGSLDTRLSVEDIAVQKSEELLKAVKLEYKRGIKDSSSLASATETLMTTQLKSLDLKRDWYNTKVKLLTLTGEVVDPKLLQ